MASSWPVGAEQSALNRLIHLCEAVQFSNYEHNIIAGSSVYVIALFPPSAPYIHHSRQCVWTETRLGGRRGGTTVSSTMVHHQVIAPSPTRTTGVWCYSSTVRTSRALIPPLWPAVTTLSFWSWRITHSLSSLGDSLNCMVRSCGQTGLFDAYRTTTSLVYIGEPLLVYSYCVEQQISYLRVFLLHTQHITYCVFIYHFLHVPLLFVVWNNKSLYLFSCIILSFSLCFMLCRTINHSYHNYYTCLSVAYPAYYVLCFHQFHI